MSNKGRQDWFTRLLSRKGDDYISSGKLQDIEITRNLPIIIDDIINGRIDYSIHGNTILMPVVFDNLISYCRNELSIINVSMFSLYYTISACESGEIPVSGYSNIRNKYYMNPYNLPHDNKTCITQDMRNTLSIAARDATINFNKFSIILAALERISINRNIFELQWVTNELKNYIKSTNRLMF